MTIRTEFSEISILIPGYSVEDLPVDLAESEASSLWNAIACAWHPKLLAQSASLPLLRQAESQYGYPGRRIVLVPSAAEAWMPHEWRNVLREQDHVILDGCTERAEYLTAIETHVPAPVVEGGAGIATATADYLLADDFVAFGTTVVQLQLLSRRRHHYVDPDQILLTAEIRAAAVAAATGDEQTARQHLGKAWEQLREVRERIYPQSCFLLDLCLPGEQDSAAAILSAVESASPLNLLCSARELRQAAEHSPAALDMLAQAAAAGRLQILGGHAIESRTGLGSMAALINDLRQGAAELHHLLGITPQHWARRRFGLTASLPAVLAWLGYQSALHVALDDGLYPDRERSQFDWQSPDGSLIAAASRIPLAIDSAAGFQKLADRLNESMQEDQTAAVFLARLPTTRSPWLNDLRRAAAWAPVLGEFATMDQLCRNAEGSRLAEMHQHSDYLSPALIQSAVLKTEPPVTGPARIRCWQQELESLRQLTTIARVMKADLSTIAVADQLTGLEQRLADTELLHVDLDSMLPEKQPQLDTAWDGMRQALRLLRDDLADAVSSRIPSQPAEGRGLLLLNTLPFARTHEVQWPAAWRRPAAEAAVEAAQEATGNSPTSQAIGERLLVKLPPGGFVWLHEADPGRPTQTLTTAARREPPLAENLKLRNRHFEVTLSERTGGVASVLYHGQRGNRLSQQSGYRYEREITLPDDGSGEIRKVSYAVPELLQHKVLEAGTVFAALETTTEFHSPQDGKTLGRVVQVTRVDRVRPRLEIVLTVQDAVTAPVKGNPWLAGWCCRFAWEQESALVHRSVLGQSAGFRLERIESSEYVEAEDGTRRMVIASDGRPWHRRAGSRMLDSLLVCEGETERTFRFWIDFDQPHPLRTAEEMLTPVVTHTVEGRVPVGTSSAWILGLSARNVQLVRSDYQPRRPVESDVLSLILSETDGLGGDCLIRTARKPTAAYEMHPGRQARSTLALSPEGVVVAFSPWQLKEIQLIF